MKERNKTTRDESLELETAVKGKSSGVERDAATGAAAMGITLGRCKIGCGCRMIRRMSASTYCGIGMR